jgi:putative intracellular protease/amidase
MRCSLFGLALSLLAFVGCSTSPDESADDDISSDEAAISNGAPRVLVVLSAARSIELQSGGTTPAGVYLAEVAVPVRRLINAGARITVVSPGGAPPALDEVSDKERWFENEREYADAKAIFAHGAFQHPGRLEAVTDTALANFDAVFLPGGHAPMSDLVANPDLARILRRQHAANKLTGAICHGTSGLLAPRVPGQPWIYAGYKLTGYSEKEEKIGVGLGYVGGTPKLQLQKELEGAGARYEHSLIPFTSHVEHDRELVTGQDPQSTHEFAKEFTKALLEQRGR